MKKLILLLALLLSTQTLGDQKISQMPTKAASATNSTDYFPMVDTSGALANKKILLSDLINIPAIATTYAPLASPTFTGTLTAPTIDATTFVGALTGHASLDLSIANNLSDLANASTSRTNLGLGTSAVQNSTFFLQVANNLSDVGTKATAFNNISPLTTGGDLLYGGTSGAGTRLANGLSGQVLKSGGGTTAPSWLSIVPESIQRFTSSTGTYNLDYSFIITSGNATAAATYTNNSVTFTVNYTVASATLVVMSGSGPPTASGTLTKTGGTGDSTLTFSQFKAPFELDVLAIGGGGAGSSGGGTVTAAGAGAQSSFGTTLITAPGGTGAAVGTLGTLGGSGASSGACGTGPVTIQASSGGPGGNGFNTSNGPGGMGGNTLLAGGGANGASANAATIGLANTGGGGGGANGGGGGGQGGSFVQCLIYSPSATYPFVVGAGGSTGGGAAGGSGLIVVRERYQ